MGRGVDGFTPCTPRKLYRKISQQHSRVEAALVYAPGHQGLQSRCVGQSDFPTQPPLLGTCLLYQVNKLFFFTNQMLCSVSHERSATNLVLKLLLLISRHSTLLCAHSLLSSAIGCSLHVPAPRLAIQVPHFQVPCVYKVPFCSPNDQSTLCHHLVNTSQDLTLLPAAHYDWTPFPSSQVTLQQC